MGSYPTLATFDEETGCLCIVLFSLGIEASYLTQNYDGHAGLIEIKRPTLGFWATERDHENLIPHSDLVKAITQAQNYQFELEREMNSVKTLERTDGCPIAKPRSLLIHGRSNTWGKNELRPQRLLNGGLSGLQILTYDQVLSRAKRTLGIELRS